MRNKNLKTQNRRPKILYAKKSFGQNFLVDENYINKIITVLNPQPDETIVEIGAGRGALTEKLVESGANVIAIEIERDMVAVLREKFAGRKNFQLVESDALKVDFREVVKTENAKLAANLPYYISTAILQKLIEQREIFSEMILMFQREVVERITAKAGNSGRGFLTVLTEAYLDTEKLFDVPPNAFRPAPKIWSSVARLITKENIEIDFDSERAFREIVSQSFRQKRKTLINNLSVESEYLKKYSLDRNSIGLILRNLNIDSTRRAESLTIAEWKKLTNSLTSASRKI